MKNRQNWYIRLKRHYKFFQRRNGRTLKIFDIDTGKCVNELPLKNTTKTSFDKSKYKSKRFTIYKDNMS
jgi:hypothetical protein